MCNNQTNQTKGPEMPSYCYTRCKNFLHFCDHSPKEWKTCAMMYQADDNEVDWHIADLPKIFNKA